MTYNPSSQIYLCDVPFTKSHADIIDFTSQNDQLNYFRSRVNKTYNEYVYVKKDNMIKVEGNLDELVANNYLFYKNPSSGKYYYCFIDRMEYISENTTGIYFTTDAWQTWGFNIEYMPSFIERKHVTNDGVGANTIPEGLETGEYIVNSTKLVDDYYVGETLVYVLGCTANPIISDHPDAVGNLYGGIYSGVRYYFTNKITTLSVWLQGLADTRVDSIVSLFMAPKWIIGSDKEEGEVPASFKPQMFEDIHIDMINSLNGYTPRNKKLLTYPYCFVEATNGVGGGAVYHQELFNNLTGSGMRFQYIGVLTPGCSTKMYPISYGGLNDPHYNFEIGLTGGKYPQCNWATDQFTNWLTQNGVNVATSIASDFISMYTGFASGAMNDLGNDKVSKLGVGSGTIGATTGAINSMFGIMNTMRTVENHRMIAPQIGGNVNSGDVATSSNSMKMIINSKTIKAEFARSIDDYFDKYGYKVNTVETPNVRTRRNWNFIKTIGFNLKGNIPQTEMEEIKAMFDSGVTIWHNPSTIYDYNQSNGII